MSAKRKCTNPVTGIPTGLDVSLACIRSPCASKEEQSVALGHTTMVDTFLAQPEIPSVAPTSSIALGQPTPKFR